MPYTENHALLRFGGPAWGDQEIWSCGLRLRHLGGDEPNALVAETVATISAVYDVVLAYFTRLESMFSNGVRLSWVELNGISASTGKYLQPNNPVREERAPVSGTAPNGIPQVASCVSLRGMNNRGPASRGRYFVPNGFPTGSGVTSTGVLPASVCQGMADSAGTFLAALSGIDSGLGPDAWVPYLFGDGIGGPQDSPISQVSVGNVLDTQRRRRNTIVETYSVSTTFP